MYDKLMMTKVDEGTPQVRACMIYAVGIVAEYSIELADALAKVLNVWCESQKISAMQLAYYSDWFDHGSGCDLV